MSTVHTTGINWESVLVLVGAIVTILSVVIGAFLRQQGNAIKNAMNNMTVMLEAKLETKEKVAEIARDVAVLKTRLDNRR